MYRFFLDALAAVRLRFFASSHYRYSSPVTIAIIITLGVVNAAAYPILGSNPGAIGFWIAAVFCKWQLLSLTMRLILRHRHQPGVDWRGYVLLTEALLLPMILTLYWPQSLGTLFLLWYLWIVLVQFNGFIRISQQSAFRIMAAYLVYMLLNFVMNAILLSFFIQMGWLDLSTIMAQLQQIFPNIALQP